MENKIPKIGFEGHWSSMKFCDDLLGDSLVKHALGLVYYKMADVGEIFEIVSKINNGGNWIDEWSKTAEKLQKLAKASEKKKMIATASTAYLRSSTYWRVSLMNFDSTDDERIEKYSQNSKNDYDKYLELSKYPGKYLEIPYENTILPGYFFKAKSKSPLLILVPGRDTWALDTAWVYDAAIKRGINVLTYDGPGQGLALRLNDLTFRSDVENVITPVIDYALENFDCIDENKIMIMGLSFGGFQVPRAAAFDKRIKLCIADPGNISWGNSMLKQLSMILKIPKEQRPPQLDFMLSDYVWKHGTTEEELIDELKKFDNSDILDELDCLTLVLDGSSEINAGESKRFLESISCPKDYLYFDEDSSSQLHCQMGGYGAAAEAIFNWIDENFLNEK